MSSRSLLILLAFANFIVGMGAFVVIGVLSPVAAAFDIGKPEAGWLMTAYALVYAVASPFQVALTGRWDRAHVLFGGLTIFLVGALASALAPNFAMLLGARALMALGGGLVTPVAASIAVAVAEPAHRGRALATVFGGLTLAQVIGVPAGAWIGYALGWRATFIAVAALAFVGALALAKLTPRGVKTPSASLATLAEVMATPRLIIAVAFTALFVGGLYTVYTYLAPLVEARHGLGRDGVTAILVVFGLGAVVGNSIGGVTADRIGEGRTLAVLCAAQLILMPFLTLVVTPLAMTGIVVCVWSVFAWSFMAPQQSRVVALDPAKTPVLLALNASAIYIGGSVGSALGGQVLARAGFFELGLAGAALALLALLSLWLVARMTKKAA